MVTASSGLSLSGSLALKTTIKMYYEKGGRCWGGGDDDNNYDKQQPHQPSKYPQLRTEIVREMLRNAPTYKNLMSNTVEEYIEESSMHQEGVWGTEMEIFVAASLLKFVGRWLGVLVVFEVCGVVVVFIIVVVLYYTLLYCIVLLCFIVLYINFFNVLLFITVFIPCFVYYFSLYCIIIFLLSVIEKLLFSFFIMDYN